MAVRKRKTDTVTPIKGTPSELSETLKAANKNYGAGTVTKASDIVRPLMVSTGVFLIDLATLGGVPQSRMTQLCGRRSSGKSTITAKVIASAQKMFPDQTAVLIDTEQTSDHVWLEKLGVDIDRLQVAYCDTGEQAIDLTDALIRSKETSIVAIDSMAALTSTKEIEASVGDHLVAQQAGMITRMVKTMINAFCAERRRGHRPVVLVTNQIRSDLNGFARFGEATRVTGGKALEHAVSLNITLKNKEVKDKDDYGSETLSINEHAFSIDKNKLCAGMRKGEFKLVRYFDDESGLNEGDIDDASTMLVYAKRMGYYTGGGSSWTLTIGDTERKFKKAAEAIFMLNDDRDIKWALRNQLLAIQAKNLKMPQEIIDQIINTPNLL